MNYWVGERFFVADAEGERADRGAGVVLLFRRQQSPGESYWTLLVVS